LNDEEIIQIASKKMFLINCFLFTSALNPGEGPEPTLKHGVTGYYLQSIILELFVKIFYELDFKEQSPFTHNILNIFKQLKKDTRSLFRSKYDEARERKVKAFEKVDTSVTFPPLEDVLAANEAFVKNYKYDAMGSKSNSSVDGIFYQELVNSINKRIGKTGNT